MVKNLLRSLAIPVAAIGPLVVIARSSDEPHKNVGRAPVRVVLVGDSTVTDRSGWSAGFQKLLGAGAECTNWAKSGRSSRSYRGEGHWKKALAEHADYIVIQFGHNDQPGKGPDRETDPKTTYRDFLTLYIEEARISGAKLVLVTPMARRNFRGGHLVVDALADYAEAVGAVAAAKHVPLVDLYARSVERVESLGPDAADALGPTAKDGRPDRTHFNGEGSREMARLVFEELLQAVPELALHLTSKATSDPDDPKR
jgi:pectinesterase